MTPQTHDLLTRARALIQFPEDWTKGQMQDANTGALCVYGALCVADHGEPTLPGGVPLSDAFREAEHELANVCATWMVERGIWHSGVNSFIAGVNNHADTTHADMLAVLDGMLVGQRELVDA